MKRVLLLLSGLLELAAGGVDAAAPTLERDFAQEVRPLWKQYCLGCHSTEKHKGDLDLERFASFEEVLRQPKVWQNLIEQVSLGEMPPKEKPQPSAAEKERLMAWAQAVLDHLGRSRAGDPGPVVLRRLSNAEFTYSLRDLTGVEALDPAKEFPVDGAAGEGFMNTGNALVMSPALLTKYLDAAKEVAGHAALLPDGFRFSPKTTRRDWTEEWLAQIRAFYAEFTDEAGATAVNLQGIKLDTNKGGRLPLEKYLAALLEVGAGLRPATPDPTERLRTIAAARGLSPKYLAALWNVLASEEPSLILDRLRQHWREAKSADVPALAAGIAGWQMALWKFNTVGHIGKAGGPKAWQEPVNPLLTQQEAKLKLPAPGEGKEVTLYLLAGDAGDGNENDFVVWQRPRLVAPGRPDVLLRDARALARLFAQHRARVFAATAKCLEAAGEIGTAPGQESVDELARRHGVPADVLNAWLDYLGIGTGRPVAIEGYFKEKFTSTSGYDFIRGWGKLDTPSLLANSSDQHVRIPGNMKPHSVAVHPSPKLAAVVGWRSPTTASLRIEARVTHAHPECGNGVTWSLELRRGATRQRLAAGTAQGSREIKVGPFDQVAVQAGDLVSLLIGPRDGNHSCDLTAIDLTVASQGERGRIWDLAGDVSGDVLAGNPHADQAGHEAVWHFYTEPVSGEAGQVIPAGSLLARWQNSGSVSDKRQLAQDVQNLLAAGPPPGKEHPDAMLYRQLASLGGPLFEGVLRQRPLATANTNSPAPPHPSTEAPGPQSEIGLDPGLFGRHPSGAGIDPASLCVRAPSVIEVRLPAELVDGCEFVTTGVLHSDTGAEGSVQLQVATNKPAGLPALAPGTATVQRSDGPWTSENRQIIHSMPILVNDGSAARRRFEAAFDDFRRWFPAALCYTKIVPVDEVVTLTLFYREDDQLARLLLDDPQRAKLDRLWDELHYISHDALALVDAYEQLWQYATQDADPKVFEPLREPIKQAAAAFRQRLLDTQPKHLDGLLEFAARAYRHPLTEEETQELRGLYRKLRREDISHEEAVRLMLARVLVAPAFLYRAEKPPPGAEPGPVNDWELAARLSYFLWSSVPDAELGALAAKGRLRDPGILVAQARRMLRDQRVRRLATEFGCAWLHVHGFDTLDEKSERHFPTFAGLRGAMYEETIRFLTDLFQRDAPILSLLDADHTFLNEPLASHYGIAGVVGGQWRPVEGMRRHGRGGILGLGAVLAKQSGASRTSPILRGNWVAETLLGEKLPRPPKDVPRLPEDEAAETLTVRQLVEKHSSDPKCSGCHARIDPYGYALEGFDAIGRRRARDLGDRPVDTRAKLMDNTRVEGMEGLRDYLLLERRDAFVRQFCRKLLGYSLGRAVQLSDGPLLEEMKANLKAGEYRFSAAVESIVRSRQFREIRGQRAPAEE